MTAKENIKREGYFMLWRVGKDDKDPFIFFKNKYGYTPQLISIGKGVDIIVPKGMTVLEQRTPEQHIMLR